MKNIALVTGAGGGIGIAVVNSLLENKLTVCATDKDNATLQRLAQGQQQALNDEKLLLMPMDVLNCRQVEEVNDSLIRRELHVQILINCAGTFNTASVLQLEEDAFRKTIETNLIGVFRTCKIFGKSMVERNDGKIINIGSIAAFRGLANGAHYAASKAGLTALSQSMAIEWAVHNVRVNVVHPGYIDTDMILEHKEMLKAAALWRVPAKRLGTPRDVAEAVWSLVNTNSNYITGTQITVDGGISIG